MLDGAAVESAVGAAAAAYVSSTGAELVDVSVDGTRVSVRVAATVDPWFPVMAARTVTSTASATATVGP